MKNIPLLVCLLTFTLFGAACQKATNTNVNTDYNKVRLDTNALTINAQDESQPKPTESGCAQEGSIKSPASTNQATITFDNQTSADVKVYWINFDGARQFYTDVKANTKKDQATWVGHVWVVADGAEQCLKLHSANAVMQTLVIN